MKESIIHLNVANCRLGSMRRRRLSGKLIIHQKCARPTSWGIYHRVITSKKKSAGFVASQAQKKAKARQKKKKSARQMRLFS